MATAAPWLLLRQRGAATLQPSGANGYGPKGVEPTAFTTLSNLSVRSPEAWDMTWIWIARAQASSTGELRRPRTATWSAVEPPLTVITWMGIPMLEDTAALIKGNAARLVTQRA